ncbi:MAG: hypothetical protein Q8L77_09545 [Nitrospirota bacterium]|nr:hypothetical protein [Nitrospirota bacterium]
MKFTSIEQEVIFLKASNESIGLMVNHEVIKLSEGDNGAQAIFKTSIHQRFFNIILVDFLSRSAEEVTGEKISSLEALVKICETPNFNQHNSVKSLRRAVTAFKKWLEHEIKVKVWFPSVDLGTKVKIQRQEIIKICGDISKHTFSRLHVRARQLKSILKRNGKEVSDDDGLLLLDDFYERFHTDIFTYQGSHIVEQLNGIRWGIQEYLQPELKRSMVYEDCTSPRYRYTYPNGVKTEFVKHCYQTLMNDIRTTPYIKRFKTYKILTRRY